MACFERLTGGSAVIVTVSLGTEVQKFLLATGTRLDHLLLPGPIRRHRSIARHLGLVSHKD